MFVPRHSSHQQTHNNLRHRASARTGRVLFGILCVLITGTALAEPRFSGVVFADDPGLSPLELLPAYQENLGAALDETLVARLTGTFAARYRNDGYLPPAPRIVEIRRDAGIVVLAMQEARVSQVRVQGDEPPADDEFWLQVQALKEIQPLGRAAFDAWLARVNRTDINVQGSLTQASAGSHQYLATLKLTERRWNALLHLDNRAPAALSREIAQASLGYRFADERLGYVRLDAAAALDTDRLKYVGASGVHRLRRRGESLEWNYAQSTSSLPVAGYDLNIDYDRRRLDANVVVPLARRTRLASEVSVGLHVYDLDQALDTGTELRRDRIRALQLAYSVGLVRGERHLHRLSLEARQGLDALGASLWPDSGTVDADFLLSTLNYRYQLTVNPQWRLHADVYGQITGDSLPASERFFIGGNRLGGAFDQATLSGDLGFGGRFTAERSLPMKWLESPLLGYAYYDHAYVWSNRDLRPADDAGSAGIGVRGSIGGLSFSLEGAVPVQKPQTPTLLDDQPRVFFSISQRI